jgi:hypothetical protein
VVTTSAAADAGARKESSTLTVMPAAADTAARILQMLLLQQQLALHPALSSSRQCSRARSRDEMSSCKHLQQQMHRHLLRESAAVM